MKRAESKVRFYPGLILGLVLAALGGCSGGFSPDAQEAQEAVQGDLIPVKVAVGTTGRSVNPGSIEIFVNFYEVIFRDRRTESDKTDDVYYRGTGTGSEGYVSVSVLPGKTYDVLLLAGYNRTLLGAGYVGVNSGTGPVTIESGRANVVSISVTKLAPQWDTAADNTITTTNDFAFSANFGTINLSYYGLPTTSSSDEDKLKLENRYIHLLPNWDPKTDESQLQKFDQGQAKFRVTFNIAKLAPLIQANWSTQAGSKQLTIEGYEVALIPRYPGVTEDDFTPAKLPYVRNNDPEASISGSPSSPPYTYQSLGENSVIAFTNDNPNNADQRLPNKHVDGVLRFELKYYAFGTSASGGTLWFIRNGLNRNLDIGTNSGGDFLVKIGKEGSAERTEPVTVSTQ